MGIFTTTFLAECEAPVITNLTRNSSGYLVIDFTISTVNSAGSRYEVATDPGFTNLVVYNVGTHTSPVTTAVLVDTYSTLYVRMRKYCSHPVSGTFESSWSNVATWTTIPTSTIYVSNVVRQPGQGTADFTLHVENEPFIGYFCAVLTSSTVNGKQVVGSTFAASYVLSPKILSGSPLGTEDRVNVAVNIPIGIYTGCNIYIQANTVNIAEDVNYDMAVIFSKNTILENGIQDTYVAVDLQRAGIDDGGGGGGPAT